LIKSFLSTFFELITILYLVVYSLFSTNIWTHGFSDNPQNFLPNSAITDSEKTISRLFFRDLLYYDTTTSEITYDLIESVKRENNGISYRVKLKPNQYWDDGIEITSNDLIYTASLNKDLQTVFSSKIDKYTVIFTLPKKYSPFESLLELALEPSHLSLLQNPEKPIGNKGYKVLRLKKENNDTVFIQTYNRDAKINTLNFRFYKNDEDLIKAYKLNEIDSFLTDKNLELDKASRIPLTFKNRSYLALFNTRKSTLGLEVRKSIVSGIDILKLNDSLPVPTGPFSGTWAETGNYIPVSQNTKNDLDGIEEINISTPKTEEGMLYASRIKEQLEKKGVDDVNITEINTNDFVETINTSRGYDIVIAAHEYKKDPDRFVFWHSSQNNIGLNFTELNSNRIDTSLLSARESYTLEERKGHYKIFEQAFTEEVPAFFISHPKKYFYFSNKLKIAPFEVPYPFELFNELDTWSINEQE